MLKISQFAIMALLLLLSVNSSFHGDTLQSINSLVSLIALYCFWKLCDEWFVMRDLRKRKEDVNNA